ncbi:hypothetical protein EVAR_94246_1 [Eumeta japonica]|uniref:Uncharacterized protein n=1 Tax=Eumeta variegata TaxID=151549 RepID=A0A4C1UPE1_EUMVA|nr:hypothetical protein EVAR_94246_1 [Eumeta japonica]
MVDTILISIEPASCDSVADVESGNGTTAEVETPAPARQPLLGEPACRGGRGTLGLLNEGHRPAPDTDASAPTELGGNENGASPTLQFMSIAVTLTSIFVGPRMSCPRDEARIARSRCNRPLRSAQRQDIHCGFILKLTTQAFLELKLGGRRRRSAVSRTFF